MSNGLNLQLLCRTYQIEIYYLFLSELDTQAVPINANDFADTMTDAGQFELDLPLICGIWLSLQKGTAGGNVYRDACDRLVIDSDHAWLVDPIPLELAPF